ncbi:hypothetical protein [Rhizobium sp. AAP43]|uniref:hypothetical protein n=1 Tax=Rhizobium sp. AAP43 TaxID=1523420 RepID=UPI0006B8CA89|nr:hypothetical protein [Rhizobium sp. AAP43]KPF43301.1 hypothetical protein IP76_14355 [Rhizobium sp. AAP43]
MMRNAVMALPLVTILMALPALADASKLRDGDILISRHSSNDAVSYATSRSEVYVRREDNGQEAGRQYLVEFSDHSQSNTSYRFDATPHVELFEIVGLEVTKAFCRREIAVVTIREYMDIDEPRYLYRRVFLELGKPGKGFEYLDGAATDMGGPTPIGLLEDYVTIDCSTMPIELTDKSR